MRSRNIWGTCLAIIVLALGAAAQQSATTPQTVEPSSPAAGMTTTATTPPAGPAQKVVLKVGSARVTQAEIDALVAKLDRKAKAVITTQGLRPAGDEYVRMLLLSQRALEEHLDSSPDLRMQLELHRAQTLAQAEYQKMSSGVHLTQEEVSQYFTAHRSEFEAVQVREFLIRKRPPDSSDPKQGLSSEEARTAAESIRKALLGGTDIDEVEQGFVGASTSKNIMLVDRQPRTFRRADMKPALEKATFDVPAGGVSEVVDTPQAFLIVKVLAHERPELKDVAPEIQTKLQRQKLDAEIDAMKQKTGVWMDEDYFKGPVAAASASTSQRASVTAHSKP